MRKNKDDRGRRISEAELLMADDDWNDFFSAADPDDLEFLEQILRVMEDADRDLRDLPEWYVQLRATVLGCLPLPIETDEEKARGLIRDTNHLKKILAQELKK